MVHELVRQHWKLLSVIAISLMVLGGLTYSLVAPGGRFADVQNDLKAISPAAQASYTDLDGNPVDIRDLDGKPLIINSWATWMPFSVTELPILSEAAREYGDTVTIVAMNRMESAATVRSFLSTFAIPEDSIIFALDPSDTFYKAVGGYAMPETLFYAKDGVLAEHYRGVLTKELLTEHMRVLLEQN